MEYSLSVFLDMFMLVVAQEIQYSAFDFAIAKR